ncbi:hypothetical protein RYH70_09580 [Alloalcanivorax xenomutans]|uniref:Sulfurtransferase complex subunit TusB n=1 Tax=Alloalcanivorax balearicus MACL04 TaxID=1177182 RepID=A0ABT2QYR7_9GAMM|nr:MULTISPECIES: hypothetical protein [Alloalcanivorax]MCU5782672.1 hypothetical protein [Alloalcanivorax balearicus MACL04]WOD30307.1 hypothetical protein RYH70_09580 [Alloalcanivorax xenomutans]
MLHLIAFDDLDSEQARTCLALYQPGDLCVFVDHGHLVAAEFPLQGPGYLLGQPPLPPARRADLECIDYDRLVALTAEYGPATSWYS